MARGPFSPSSYTTTAAFTGDSVREGSSGVTFGSDFEGRNNKRPVGPGTMSRAHFPQFERRYGAFDEGGDRPSRGGQIKACILCGITETPLWRANDIDGEKNLCNACGVRQNRLKRARRMDDAAQHSTCHKGHTHRQTEGSSASPIRTKRAASARLDRLLPMLGDGAPISRAWSLGHLGDFAADDLGPFCGHQTSHSDPVTLHSMPCTSGLASLEETAFHGISDQLSCLWHADTDLEFDLDPLDPRFLARIHDPHQ